MRLLSVNTFQPDEANATVAPSRFPVPGPVPVPSAQIPGHNFFGLRESDGDRQIVSVYSRLDYDYWQTRLGRAMPNGIFGEHLTTHDVDLANARIGERWRVGSRLVLEVAGPRVPSGRFREWLYETGWLEMFLAAERPGVFARVIEPGTVEAGDPIIVQSRPDHDVTIWAALRALAIDADALPTLLRTPTLPDHAVRLLRQYKPHAAPDEAVST